MNRTFHTLKYKTDDIELDVNYSPEDNNLWLTKEQLAILFKRDRSVITRHINNIIKSQEIEEGATCAKNAQVQFEGDREVTRIIDFYNLEMVIAISRRVKSNNGLLLKEFLDNYLNQETVENKQDIIIYNNGNVKLDVKISPEEDTVWLNQAQIAELFETTQPNVSMHINNIYETGELETGATYKDFLYVQFEGGRKECNCRNN